MFEVRFLIYQKAYKFRLNKRKSARKECELERHRQKAFFGSFLLPWTKMNEEHITGKSN